MPSEENFIEKKTGAVRLQVIKTYDASFAREAFAEMDQAALDHLAASLTIDEKYDLGEIPLLLPDYVDFLWDELVETAREHGHVCSFFIVKRSGPQGAPLYVSGDWPAAEAYLRQFAQAA